MRCCFISGSYGSDTNATECGGDAVAGLSHRSGAVFPYCREHYDWIRPSVLGVRGYGVLAGDEFLTWEVLES